MKWLVTALFLLAAVIEADVYVFSNYLFKTDGNIGSGRYLNGENSICALNPLLNSSVPETCNRSTIVAWLGCGPAITFNDSENVFLSDNGLYFPIKEGDSTWGGVNSDTASDSIIYPGNFTYVWTGLMNPHVNSTFCCDGFTANFGFNGQIAYYHAGKNQGVFPPGIFNLATCQLPLQMLCLCQGSAPPLVTAITKSPSRNPTKMPSRNPTRVPSAAPSRNPTQPTELPTVSPSTRSPSRNPTKTSGSDCNCISQLCWVALGAVMGWLSGANKI